MLLSGPRLAEELSCLGGFWICLCWSDFLFLVPEIWNSEGGQNIRINSITVIWICNWILSDSRYVVQQWYTRWSTYLNADTGQDEMTMAQLDSGSLVLSFLAHINRKLISGWLIWVQVYSRLGSANLNYQNCRPTNASAKQTAWEVYCLNISYSTSLPRRWKMCIILFMLVLTSWWWWSFSQVGTTTYDTLLNNYFPSTLRSCSWHRPTWLSKNDWKGEQLREHKE